jgi:hypothetical protein
MVERSLNPRASKHFLVYGLRSLLVLFIFVHHPLDGKGLFLQLDFLLEQIFKLHQLVYNIIKGLAQNEEKNKHADKSDSRENKMADHTLTCLSEDFVFIQRPLTPAGGIIWKYSNKAPLRGAIPGGGEKFDWLIFENTIRNQIHYIILYTIF